MGYFENSAPRMRYHWFRQCGQASAASIRSRWPPTSLTSIATADSGDFSIRYRAMPANCTTGLDVARG